jgi:hypothetical protein
VDVDPHRGVVALAAGLAEHAVGDVGLRGRRRARAARRQIIEQLAQPAALADTAGASHALHFGEEALLLTPVDARR